MKFLKAAGKVVLAIILGYAGFMLSALVGGLLAGFLGALLALSKTTISLLSWTLANVLFLER
jgi:hypothetical protein